MQWHDESFIDPILDGDWIISTLVHLKILLVNPIPIP